MRRSHALLAGFIALWSGLSPTLAAERVVPAEFVERVWLMDEGLPHNVVHRVAQDKRNFMWLATRSGLARFDGRECREWLVSDGTQSARDLAVAPDGSLVLLTAKEGVRVINGRESRDHPMNAELEERTLSAVFIEPNGAVWAASNMLFRWHEGRLQRFETITRRPQPTGYVWSFAQGEAGEVWVAIAGVVWRYAEGKLTVVEGDFGDRTCVAKARNGGVWIAAEDRLLLARKGKIETVHTSPAWAALGQFVELFEDNQEVLWVVTQVNGVFRLVNGALQQVPLSHERVLSITQDSEGNMWLGTNGGGLIRLRPKTFIQLDTAAGLGALISTSVAEDPTGSIWLANRAGGLARWRDQKLERITTEDGPLATFVPGLVCPDRTGHLWVSELRGLFKIPVADPARAKLISEVTGPIDAMHCTRNGDVWVSARKQPWGFFRDGVYHSLSDAEDVPQGRPTSFAEDAEGDLWVATLESNLYEFRAGRFVQHKRVDEHFRFPIHALHFDTRGTLWLGTQHGLARKHGNGYQFITTEEGLPDTTITQMVEDDFGRLWIGTRRGLSFISIEQVEAVMEGRETKVFATTLGRDEGLIGISALSGGPPTTWKGEDGQLWFVTYRGVIGIDPAAVATSNGNGGLPSYVDAVLIDGRAVDVRPDTPVLVPPATMRVEFRFVVPSFSSPGRVRVRHQLVGLDPDWVETGASFSATYAGLPPGKYTLRVAGVNESGTLSESATSLVLMAQPAWWQTWWFRGAAVLAFAGLIVGVVRFWSQRRFRRLQQAHALEQERARIARDLHDELGGSLTQIGFLADRIRRQAGDAGMNQPLSELAARTRRVAADLESIVWTVSPKNDTWAGLVHFLSEYAQRFFSDAGIDCVVEASEVRADLPVSPEVQHHLLAIAKEGMNNLLKHAKASRVVFLLRAEENMLIMSLCDNGIGFDLNAPENGERNGLTNMRTRAQEIGGVLELTSSASAGTNLTLRVPFDATARRPLPASSKSSLKPLSS